jgi:ATP-dependent Clp protease ATP-binding subunit ClpB
LNEAENIAKKMNDEFVSIEHLILFCFQSKVAQILKTRELLKRVADELRKERKVTSASAEEKTHSLNKYENLNELAKDGKLDPVIGRDDENRRIVILTRRTKNNQCLGEPEG